MTSSTSLSLIHSGNRHSDKVK